MKKKKIVIALGHDALGTTLPEQHEATKHTAKAVADFIRDDYEVVITHSNGPQVGIARSETRQTGISMSASSLLPMKIWRYR